MLTQYHLPVSLCFLSTDLPILTTIETAATLYQRNKDKYHLVLRANLSCEGSDQLIWLELSPYRVVMTLQSHEQLCYRHLWEKGVYGTSRYWLNQEECHLHNAIILRNYTRNLSLNYDHLPKSLRLDYELWSPQVCLGHYVLHLELEY